MGRQNRRHDLDASAIGWGSIADVFLLLTVLLLVVCLGMAAGGHRLRGQGQFVQAPADERARLIAELTARVDLLAGQLADANRQRAALEEKGTDLERRLKDAVAKLDAIKGLEGLKDLPDRLAAAEAERKDLADKRYRL